jgi:hypothetical protein
MCTAAVSGRRTTNTDSCVNNAFKARIEMVISEIMIPRMSPINPIVSSANYFKTYSYVE